MTSQESLLGVDPLRHDARGAGRVGSDLPVELHVAELPGPLAARSRDIGLGGICVATASAFALQSVKRVVIGLPSGPLSLEAEGRWQFDASGDDGVLSGFAFPSLSQDAIESLSNLVLESGRALARFLYAQSDLRDLGLEEVLGLAQITRFRDVSAGRFVYRQDAAESADDSIFLVSRGAVSLHARARGSREICLARLQVGDLFGGMPLVGDAPHPESALAESDCRLLEIDRDAYRYLFAARPWLAQRLAFTVARIYARRLHAVLGRIRDQL